MMKGTKVEQHIRTYRRLKPIRKFLTVASLVLMIFSKPMWCEADENISVRNFSKKESRLIFL